MNDYIINYIILIEVIEKKDVCVGNICIVLFVNI